MPELHLPLIEAAIFVPLLAALVVSRLRSPDLARLGSVLAGGLSLVCTTAAWQDFLGLGVPIAHDHWDVTEQIFGHDVFAIDYLTAPLLPTVALLFVLTMLSTLRTKIRRFSFGGTLLSLALTLATLCCQDAWGIIGLLALGVLPPYFELHARGKSTRVYALHMGAFVGLMVFGQTVHALESSSSHSLLASVPLLMAGLIRCGVAPTHVWLTDLYENATFGTALLFTTPLCGAYAIVHLVLPIAPQWVMQGLGFLSLITAVYAAGMAMVQTDVRRFFCYLFLSQSSLVLVGLESVSHIGLTGGLCVWASVALALSGYGLTLRALESRFGRFELRQYRGLFEHVPTLAACFLLTGLGSVGFPGTIGFVGTEILIDGIVGTYPYVGALVVIAAAFNGIAILRAYFLIFTGTRHVSAVSLSVRVPERLAFLTLSLLILGGGFVPQPGINMSSAAADEIITLITQTSGDVEPGSTGSEGARVSEIDH